jgi:hypothetical protein
MRQLFRERSEDRALMQPLQLPKNGLEIEHLVVVQMNDRYQC